MYKIIWRRYEIEEVFIISNMCEGDGMRGVWLVYDDKEIINLDL